MSSPAIPAANHRPAAWTGEIRSGFNGALVALPGSLSYGLAAFAPLGPAYAGHAMMAALLAAIIAPLICWLLGMRNLQVFTARSVSSVVLAGFLTEVLTATGGQASPLLILQAVLLWTFTVGLFELAFGAARVGSLAKFLPGPVMTGFTFGVGIVLLTAQVGGLLGVGHKVHWGDLAQLGQELRPLAPLVAATVIASAFLIPRRWPRLPVYLVALLAGTLVHWVLVALGGAALLGPRIGDLHLEWPDFAAARHLADEASMSVLLPLLPAMLGWAATAAIIATTDSLISHKVIEDLTDRKINSNHELLRVGAANLTGALCGAIHVGVSIPSTVGTFVQGARSARASVFVGLGLLLCVAVMAPAVALIPAASIAGLLIVIAIRLFDPWTLQLIWKVVSGKLRPDRDLIGLLATVATVAGLALFWSFLVAVGTGLVIAIASFIWRMSRSIIRRRALGTDLQSRTIRAPAVREQLTRHGARIAIFELEGPLFFGTGEKLIAELDGLTQTHPCAVILDVRRVNDIDSTGARLLVKSATKLARQGTLLLICGTAAGGPFARMLGNFGLATEVRGTMTRYFADLDLALEWAEDLLLEQLGVDPRQQDGPVRLEELDMLRGFTADEVQRLGKVLDRATIAAGQDVFRYGEAGNKLYAIAAGRASVVLDGPTGSTRLVTFSAGAFFGEMALLDQRPRSATVRADTDLECWVLDEAGFETLQRNHPACAIKLLANLGRELSARLRSNNTTIQALSR